MLASDLAPRLGRVDSPSSPFSDVADVTSIDCFGDGTCLMARYISSGWELRKAQPGGPSELIGALEGQEGSPQVFLSH